MLKKLIIIVLISFSLFLTVNSLSCTLNVTKDDEKVTDEEVVSEEVVEEIITEEVQPKPAEFILESLSISPTEIKPYQSCTVTVDVTNIGELKGDYEVTLCLNDEVVEMKQVVLDGGITEKVSFTFTKSLSGTYTIDVNGLTGSVKVLVSTEATMLGPGGGGWIRDISIEPGLSGSVFVACDVGGIYTSTNDGESWEINNNGLTNYLTFAIAINPDNPEIIYIGTAGGVLKSTDNGENWILKRNGFPDIEKWAFSAPVSALAIDPGNPDILYAGIGRFEVFEGFDGQQSGYGQGTIYKTVDGGENWFIVNTGNFEINASAVILSMAIDPVNTNILYVATDKGLYKSTDSGVNWVPKNEGIPLYPGDTTPTVRKVLINPLDPDTLYVTVRAKPNTAPWQGGVYKSTDGGENWVSKCNGLPNYAGGQGTHPMVTANLWQMVIDADNPETLYVAVFSWGSSGIYKTVNGGDNWVCVTNITGPGRNMDLGWIDFIGTSVKSIKALAIDLSNPNRLYFGTDMTLHKTNDGGVTWQQVYTKETASGTWSGTGLETTCIFDIAIDETNSENIYVGYADIGFLKSTDGGLSFQRCEIEDAGNMFDIVVDPDSPNTLYAGVGWWERNSGWVVKSTDYGESWLVIGSTSNGLPDAQVRSIVIDPTTTVESRTLYITSRENGVYKSVDGGLSWVSINNGIGDNRYVNILVIDPNDPDTLYVGIQTISQNVEDYGGIYKTTDGGNSWVKANQNIELPNVNTIAIDPSDSNILYAGTNQHYTQPSGPLHLGGVYKSTDGGVNWQEMLADNPLLDIFNISTIAVSPVNHDIIYAGVFDAGYHDICPGRGIYRSNDGGETWEKINAGISVLNINVLTPHPTDQDIVYAGTHGNSIYRIVIR